MRYTVTEKNQAGTIKTERYQIIAKDRIGYETRLYVAQDDFDRISVGDTIELLITVIQPDAA